MLLSAMGILASIPVTRRHPAPTTSKDTCDIESETELESGRKSSEDEDELDNEDPNDLDLLHLNKASLKEKMSSEVHFSLTDSHIFVLTL